MVEADLAHDGTTSRTSERVFGSDVDRGSRARLGPSPGRFLGAAEIVQHASFATSWLQRMLRHADSRWTERYANAATWRSWT